MSSPYRPDDENGVEKQERVSPKREERSRSPRRERKEKKKKKHRSRSRSRDRRRHRSRSKSRERRRSRSRSGDRKSKKSRRKKPSQFWDVPPPGFEHITPLQYKALQATGQLPVAGAALPPSIMQMGDQGGGNSSVSAAIAAAPMAQSHITRQARRLYLGNIPFGTTEDAMTEFFNKQMKDCGLACAAGNPVIATQINFERNFAFLELRSVEETTNCLAFDGISFMGQTLKIRRPNDYKPLPAGQGGMTGGPGHIPGIVSTFVEETPNKLFIGSLPSHLNEDQVKELLTSFGMLKSFTLVKDSSTGESKGYAFCEYIDPKNAEQAIEGLNGMSLGEKKLIVNRAGANQKQTSASAVAGIPLPIQGMDLMSTLNEATEVLCLMNMITLDDLLDDDEYQEILEDVREECGKYGRVRNVIVPRPIEGQAVPGQGKIFCEFASPEDTKKAAGALAGRKFANRVVVTSYYNLEKFRKRDF